MLTDSLMRFVPIDSLSSVRAIVSRGGVRKR
jgi:hypothetical protein